MLNTFSSTKSTQYQHFQTLSAHRVELYCLFMSMAIFDLGWTLVMIPYMFNKFISVFMNCIRLFACTAHAFPIYVVNRHLP